MLQILDLNVCQNSPPLVLLKKYTQKMFKNIYIDICCSFNTTGPVWRLVYLPIHLCRLYWRPMLIQTPVGELILSLKFSLGLNEKQTAGVYN